tara:strand:+ start:2166 stop:3491 length:1326 start_codon:yes stop_codon:yes gene_type:complete
MKKRILVIILFFCLYNFSFSQGKFIIQNNKQSDKIKFKLINNIIAIPVEINGVTLSFLLDTGVSKPIIFNFLNVSDTLKIKNTETISLRGLGEGESVDALKSKRNIIKIGDAINLNQDLYAVYDVNLNFAPRLGFPVHGIIGYDLFKDFVVEINYSNKFLRLTQPKKYTYKKCKKCERLNLEFYNSKPYINAEVWTNKRIIPVKLLIDSGGSDALWLFEDDSLGIKSSDKYFYDFLGHGLSGSVYGKRSKVENFALKNFVLDNVNVSYPDSTFISYARKHKNRNGSLSGNILKRFNVIFDYQRAIITLKKNNLFNDEFNYNKSGIELAHDGMRILRELNKSNIKQNSTTQSSNNNIILDNQYQISLKPAYAIVELRKDSPAEQAGLKIGDILISINGKQTYQLRLNQIIQMFYDDDGKKIRMRVDRGGDALIFNFKLKKLF